MQAVISTENVTDIYQALTEAFLSDNVATLDVTDAMASAITRKKSNPLSVNLLSITQS